MKKRNPLVIGLDISDKHTHICVLDDSGQVVFRDRIGTARPGPAEMVRETCSSAGCARGGAHTPR